MVPARAQEYVACGMITFVLLPLADSDEDAYEQTQRLIEEVLPAVYTGGEREAMKLIVFGATGKTGLHVCQSAAEQGHAVTAFTRSPDKVVQSPRPHVAHGDVLDAEAVAAAVAGHDAAIVALGSNGLRDKTTLTAGTKTVVDGMALHGVGRLVVLSAAGVGDSWGQVSLLARVMFRTLLRNILADHTAQEALVRASSLDWTIVRAAILNDEPATGSVTATRTGSVRRIGRADLAAFLAREASEGTYRGQAISVTS